MNVSPAKGSIFSYSESYVPVFPEFLEACVEHEKVHWGEWEVKLDQDVEDWKLGRITEGEKAFILSVFRLFTQSDVAVGQDYYDNLIPVIRNNEARNMLGSFAAREGVHQRAYALLNDTLGKGHEFYIEFLEYKEMKEKIEFMLEVSNETVRDIALGVAKQILAEGVMLFASFAMLLNFQRIGIMMGMGDVNQWSIRDESLHVKGLALLFNQIIKEHPEIVDDAFKKEIYDLGREVVKLEDAFITRAFQEGTPRLITEEETKQYIRAVTDYRMQQIGFKPEYNVENPFTWLDWLVSNNMVENFFENNTTAYSKDSMIGEYNGGY